MEQKQTPYIKLTKRDMDVMNVLWNSETPKNAAMIIKEQPELAMNTVQAVLRKLLKSNYIKVADIVYSGTVLSRSYIPTISRQDYAIRKMVEEYKSWNGIVSKTALLSALLDAEADQEAVEQDIRQLRERINCYAKKLQNSD